ncbi:MAG: hypothetical protein LBU58_05090, partial [Clostridiales bacterium]|nr:hypothetical protein [Clostridiales bacterium]
MRNFEWETVALDESRGALVINDPTLLPSREELLSLTTQAEIREAIYLLKVRGAPAIGVAAAIGLYLAARGIAAELAGPPPTSSGAASPPPSLSPRSPTADAVFYAKLRAAKDYLNAARPTDVNLSWALNRMERAALALEGEALPRVVEALRRECIAIKAEDACVCEAIGAHGLRLLRPGMGLLTHCNAGRLATASR